jgi:hypothetical protein
VRFLDQRRVPFERVYRYDMRAPGGTTAIVLRMENTRERGLGVPLPQGGLTLMEPDANGGLLLAGQERLDRDVPIGLPLELTVGQASDLAVTTRLVNLDARGQAPDSGVRTYEVVIANHKPVPAVLEVRDFSDRQRITEATRPHVVKDARFVWRIELAPGQVETLRYTIAPS